MVALIMVAIAAFFLGATTRENWWWDKKRSKSIEYSWGLPKTTVDELEEWWNNTESDKAKIKKLEHEIKFLTHERDTMFSLVNSRTPEYVPTPTLSNPNKVMILPKGVSYYALTAPKDESSNPWV